MAQKYLLLITMLLVTHFACATNDTSHPLTKTQREQSDLKKKLLIELLNNYNSHKDERLLRSIVATANDGIPFLLEEFEAPAKIDDAIAELTTSKVFDRFNDILRKGYRIHAIKGAACMGVKEELKKTESSTTRRASFDLAEDSFRQTLINLITAPTAPIKQFILGLFTQKWNPEKMYFGVGDEYAYGWFFNSWLCPIDSMFEAEPRRYNPHIERLAHFLALLPYMREMAIKIIQKKETLSSS